MVVDNILNYKLFDLTVDVYFTKNEHQHGVGKKIFPKINSVKHLGDELYPLLDRRVIEEIEVDLYQKLNKFS